MAEKWTQSEFIEAWSNSDNFTEVCEKLGDKTKSHSRVQVYAGRLRKAGVPLKYFRRPKASVVEIDAKAAIKQLAKIQGKTVAAVTKEGQQVAEEIAERVAKRKPRKKSKNSH